MTINQDSKGANRLQRLDAQRERKGIALTMSICVRIFQKEKQLKEHYHQSAGDLNRSDVELS
jgi:hypothetical protein